MKNPIRQLAYGMAMASLGIAVPASADTICEWMDFAGRTIAADASAASAAAPPNQARSQTQVALAMFEAVNAIDRRYRSYLDFSVADAGASQGAAVITAAYRVLHTNHPAQRTSLDENYMLAMAAFTDEASREAGRTVGEAAARAALGVGLVDPALVPVAYRPLTRPGEWSATALPVIEPVSITYRPWVLPDVEAVRPPPPPALTSARYTRDLDEVRRMGAREGSERSPFQTLMARFRITPDMMPSLRLAADAPGRSMVQNARLFALYQMTLDDASMANGAAKLHYNFWRPITSIRNADQDGNDATTRVPDWMPLIATPNHPEYPCGHCTFAAAAATVMEAEVGARPSGGVRVSSRSIPSAAVQPLASWEEWVTAVSYSRILGGVHYRFSNEAGEAIGREVGRRALSQLMQPLPTAEQRLAR